MAKRIKIEQTLLQCLICKKKFFSFLEMNLCPECTKEQQEGENKQGTITVYKQSGVGISEQVNHDILGARTSMDDLLHCTCTDRINRKGT